MQFYTQNGWAGERYEETKNLSTAQVAKLIRKELLAAYGKKCSISVRTDNYAGGSSIRVRLSKFAICPFTEGWLALRKDNANTYPQPERYVPEVKEMLAHMEAIGNAYRYSDSDGMIDYFSTNFYYDAGLDWEEEKRWIEGAEQKIYKENQDSTSVQTENPTDGGE